MGTSDVAYCCLRLLRGRVYLAPRALSSVARDMCQVSLGGVPHWQGACPRWGHEQAGRVYARVMSAQRPSALPASHAIGLA